MNITAIIEIARGTVDDLFDAVVDAANHGLKIAPEAIEAINAVLYIDRKGGTYAPLTTNKEFLTALNRIS